MTTKKKFHNVESCYVFNRWLTFAASFLTLMCGGTTYLYSSYSEDIKTVLSLNQNDVSLLGVSFYFSQVIGIFIGMAADYFGPRPVGWMSATMMGLGYGLFRFGILHHWPTYLLMISIIMVGSGSGGIYVASVPANINNFGVQHKGKVVGVLVATYGGASAVFSAIYKGFKNHYGVSTNEELLLSLDRFFLFLSLFLGCAAAFGMIFINFVPQNDAKRMEKKKEEEEHLAMLINEESESTSLLKGETYTKEELIDHAYPQYNWTRTLTSLNFWILESAFVILVGSGAVYIATVGQLVKSLGFSSDATNRCVIILSVFNATSRSFTGMISDLCSKKLARPFFLGLIGVFYAFTHAWLSFSSEEWQLYVASALIGFCYGSVYILAPVMVNELFGASYWSTNNSLLSMLPAGGNYLYSVILQAKVYKSHIPAGTDHPNECYGRECFKTTFYVVCGTCMLSIILCIVLWARTRALYRFKHEAFKLGLKG